ncbi:MAG: class F sortase [Actinobacteria bacterium]|nr:class F sortase [Actinomycetota bacterium]
MALIAGGITAAALLAGHSGYRPPSLAATTPKVAPAATPQAPPGVAAIARSAPVRVTIPAIGVKAQVIPEGTDSAGALQTPPLTARNVTGWWDGGYAPGQDGPAVIVGHVDSAAAGPLVFWQLRDLKPGDRVETTLADGATVWFTVTALQQVSKTNFPTRAVYGHTPGPTLRLITCAGAFDSATGHYADNLIVFASERPAPPPAARP